MSGNLYVVATPIGNLEDLTPRARQTLADVDLVAAEDTRHTGRLLSHLGLKKRLIALHDHNEEQVVTKVIAELEAGQSVALVSDAGTPLVSDPGLPFAARSPSTRYHCLADAGCQCCDRGAVCSGPADRSILF